MSSSALTRLCTTRHKLTRLKLLVFDECWHWMLLSEMGSYLVEKLKAGRKNNLANIFVTQSGLDAERAGYGALLNEAGVYRC
jgi:type IV secretory pathway VirB4 component